MKFRYCLAFLLLGLPLLASADRVKDLASVAGVRDNQLVGYGLVVGLDGTGDQTSQTPFTIQSIRNMLKQLGITVPDTVNPQLKNVAAVMVHSTLPPFAKQGSTIDVTVSSMGNAKSLRGGSLIMTPLKGADGQIYAMAQGNLVVGGFGAQSKDGSSISVNIPSAGRIPNGATVEREVLTPFGDGDSLTLNLHTADFTTATRMAQAIDRLLGAGSATALDGSSVRVVAPQNPEQRTAFMSILENVEVAPGDAAAKVIVNSRTGTVVIGSGVKVTAAAVTHGSLTVTISNNPIVSQPGALSGGTTVVVPNQSIDVKQEKNRMFLFNPGVALDDIVKAVNKVGAAPGDLVAILEALKQAGALKAELIVI
ncbi:MAG: flagellar basal body P-ring protein FlgI [Gammaproteobacteria bacterium]|nr:flagellar basal body P-ring protein FlgI [Gammaproteobacteria bacterium]